MSAASSAASSSASSVELDETPTVVGSLSFRLPKGWVADTGSNGDTFYYPSKSNHTAPVYAMQSAVDTSSVKGDEYSGLEAFVNSGLEALGSFKIVEKEKLEISGFPAMRVKAQGKAKNGGFDMTMQMAVAIVPGNVVALMGGSRDGKYDAEISACLDTLEIDASKVTSEDSASAGDDAQPSAAGDGVSADLKDTLDSYEAFIDEYVAFMERYKNSDDTASMLLDYSSYLQKYTEVMNKIDALDTSSLSAADYAYYIEVTSRCSQKLINASV